MAKGPSNAEVAATFSRLADLLAIRGENRFKVGAYRRAAENIAQLGESLDAIRRRDALEDIPGVGEEIAEKIGDLLDTGSFGLLREVEARYPPGVAALLTVPDSAPSARAPCMSGWASTAWMPCAARSMRATCVACRASAPT